jgi:hypothetical protein
MKIVLNVSLIVALTSAAIAQRSATHANMARIPGATYEMGTDPADVPSLMEKFGVKRAELFAEESPKHRGSFSSAGTRQPHFARRRASVFRPKRNGNTPHEAG